jgi:hypothetical protein
MKNLSRGRRFFRKRVLDFPWILLYDKGEEKIGKVCNFFETIFLFAHVSDAVAVRLRRGGEHLFPSRGRKL